jgi:Kef-type K+ transport system membrane component KefB
MELNDALYMLLIGGVVVLVGLLRPGLERLGVPPLVGYFLLGFLLRLADARWALLGAPGHQIFEFLAHVGIVVLLFRVGLESDLPGLLARLPAASVIWGGNVVVSGGLGYGAAAWILGWAFLPSLFVAVALTATSVGISVALWEEADAVKTESGALMLDVAEMDDISGVLLMGLLFALAPVLHQTPDAALLPLAAETLAWFVLKFAAFTAGCVLFSRYVEEHLTSYFERIQSWSGTIMVVLGFGMIVAAVAGLLGFSMAIGAFFAGLIFSRDPDAVKMDASFGAIHPLFAAFFFIGVGLRVDPSALGGVLLPALVLLGAAIAGKVLGTLLPALALTGGTSALLIGLSLVPRAEIMLIIMQRGLDLGAWAVTPEIFAHLVIVSAATTLLTPFLVRPLLHRHLASIPATG